ncbi:MAG: DUF1275 domain-containing protein [Candidatus Paralactobacillus gallistercoris]|uniref:DUF1275 domain-containing protein n=1 Tax=Candidatus Paralactobacillus gallistercoris TaxID=2838724 RepID=A0A948TIQ4_9LACO|nr:DUF1275 domain-containing protein [Candidatus Paralactobacillus gallistercoris]
MKIKNIYQLPSLAGLLTFIGGFLDSYSFIQRGNVLSGAQTGNIVLLSANLAYRHWLAFFTDLASLIGFGIGACIITLLNESKRDYSRLMVLWPNVAVCLIIGFLPTSFSNLVIVLFLSCTLAMQTTAFNSANGVSYNVVYSTGNFKKFIISWSKYFYTHDKKYLHDGVTYIGIIGCFISGAISSAIIQQFWHLHTIWLAGAILIGIISYYRRFE